VDIIAIMAILKVSAFSRFVLAVACSSSLLFTNLTAQAAAVNDCLISAASQQAKLAPGTWSRLLVVRYDFGLQHAYLVYEGEKGDLVTYDTGHGVQHHRTNERNSSSLARQIDPKAVWGWYVEDNVNNTHLAAN
jgi:hypothetical protein